LDQKAGQLSGGVLQHVLTITAQVRVLVGVDEINQGIQNSSIALLLHSRAKIGQLLPAKQYGKDVVDRGLHVPEPVAGRAIAIEDSAYGVDLCGVSLSTVDQGDHFGQDFSVSIIDGREVAVVLERVECLINGCIQRRSIASDLAAVVKLH